VRPGTVAYPLAVRGVRIGSPRTGTHRLGNWQSDRAIDIAVPVGTPVRATEDGVIGGPMGRSRSRDPRFAGLRLTLEGRRDTWFYAHLRSIRVRPGQTVRRGEVIGRSGAANGVAHLHIAARRANPLVVFG
jgi:murein DD-endopeptidase MepM/ murein hydrolase activator NlpD